MNEGQRRPPNVNSGDATKFWSALFSTQRKLFQDRLDSLVSIFLCIDLLITGTIVPSTFCTIKLSTLVGASEREKALFPTKN